MGLESKSCTPCRVGAVPLSKSEIIPLLEEIDSWSVNDDKKLVKSFKFDNFKQAMDLANDIAVIAENEGHHPDLLVRWGELKIELWTHRIDGLTESDFILAAKIDKAAAQRAA